MKEHKERLQRHYDALREIHGDLLFGSLDDEDDVDMDDMPALAVHEYLTAVQYIELAMLRLEVAKLHLPDEN